MKSTPILTIDAINRFRNTFGVASHCIVIVIPRISACPFSSWAASYSARLIKIWYA